MQLDFVLILVTAVLGGVFGGIGGLIGSRIGRRFPGAAKPVTSVCAIIGCAVALAVSPVIRSSLDGGRAEQELVARYDRELRSVSSLFGAIAAGWPAEYAEFLKSFAMKGSQLDQATANRLANEFAVELRQSNASLALYSEDEDLRSYFRTYVGLLEDVKARDGEQLCAALMIRGPQALEDRASQYLAHLEGASIIVMNALTEGRSRRDRGVRSALDPSDIDIRSFETFLFERTGKEGLLARMSDSQAPDLCLTGIETFGALSEFAPDHAGAHALRVATFRNIISS